MGSLSDKGAKKQATGCISKAAIAKSIVYRVVVDNHFHGMLITILRDSIDK